MDKVNPRKIIQVPVFASCQKAGGDDLWRFAFVAVFVPVGCALWMERGFFYWDAVQRGYGVIVPEQMVAWAGGQTIAWWQLDLETGEMVGVGEDGTHEGFIIGAAGILLSVAVILAVAYLVVLLWKLIQWRNAAIGT